MCSHICTVGLIRVGRLISCLSQIHPPVCDPPLHPSSLLPSLVPPTSPKRLKVSVSTSTRACLLADEWSAVKMLDEMIHQEFVAFTVGCIRAHQATML